MNIEKGFDTAFDPHHKSVMDLQLMYCRYKCPVDGFIKFQNNLGQSEFVSITDNIKLEKSVQFYRSNGMIEGMYTADKRKIDDDELSQIKLS